MLRQVLSICSYQARLETNSSTNLVNSKFSDFAAAKIYHVDVLHESRHVAC